MANDTLLDYDELGLFEPEAEMLPRVNHPSPKNKRRLQGSLREIWNLLRISLREADHAPVIG